MCNIRKRVESGERRALNSWVAQKIGFTRRRSSKTLDTLEECYFICDSDEIQYKNQKKMLTTYVENNRHIIPNYGERWRYGETITISFVESTVSEVVTKRTVKSSKCNGHTKALIIFYKQ